MSNVINTEHPLGKGEVVSSILTGSTTNPHEIRVSDTRPETYPAVSGRTEREHDKSARGKSVDSVLASLRARGQMGVIIARQLLMAKGLGRVVGRRAVARTLKAQHPRKETKIAPQVKSTPSAPSKRQIAATNGMERP